MLRLFLSLALLSALPICARAQNSWSYEPVDSAACCQSPGPTELIFDASDEPHIFYHPGFSSGELRHAYRDASGWHVELIDTGLGSSSAKTMDAAPGPGGSVHVSYRDASANGMLKYAWNDGLQWQTESVDSLSLYPSLAIDSDNRPHLCYAESGVNSVKYAVRENGVWHREYVDLTGTGGYVKALYPSLQIDASGNPAVALCSKGSPYDLLYAVRSGGGWSYESLGSTGGFSAQCALYFDSHGNPHIGYHKGGTPGGGYVHRSGSSWVPEADFPAPLPWIFVLDQDDIAHVTFSGSYGSSLRYAVLEAGQWEDELVGAFPTIGTAADLAVDSAGLPHLAVWGGSQERELLYASRQPPTAALPQFPTSSLRLGQNVPNPFNPATTIPFFVADAEQPTTLRVLDVRGRVVRTLVDNAARIGENSVLWDGMDDMGRELPSGVYLYEIRVGGESQRGKAVLVR